MNFNVWVTGVLPGCPLNTLISTLKTVLNELLLLSKKFSEITLKSSTCFIVKFATLSNVNCLSTNCLLHLKIFIDISVVSIILK